MALKFFIPGVIYSLLLLISCSKDKETPGGGLSQKPVAKAEFDNSNYGIYKGVFAGSTGTILIDIKNDNSVFASVRIEELVYTFTTTQTVEKNKATVIEFKNTDNTFTFSVAANGANPAITDIDFPGHPNAAMIAVKETSTALVKCYEGTFSGTDNGIFNAVIYGTQLMGIIKNNSNSINSIAAGSVAGNVVTANGAGANGAVFTGTITGDNIAGNWSVPSTTIAGTWTVKRTY